MLYLRKLTSLTLLLVASVAHGQLSVDVKPVKIVQTITPHIVSQVTTETGEAIGAPVETKGTPVVKPGAPSVLLFLKTERPIGELLVKIKCKTAEAVMVEPGVYSVSKPGTHELDVNVIGQNPLTWDDMAVTVTVGNAPEPEPDPDNPDPDNPDPPGPSPDVPADDFDNLGQRIDAAADAANLQVDKRQRVAEIYRDVANRMGGFEFKRSSDAAKVIEDGVAALRLGSEWTPVLDIAAQDAGKRGSMTWDQIIAWYTAVAEGLEG